MFSTFEDIHSIKRIPHDVRHRGLDLHYRTPAIMFQLVQVRPRLPFYRSHMLTMKC